MAITNQQVFDALTESIELRWEKIVENYGWLPSSVPKCQLCDLFFLGEPRSCNGCPLFIYDGVTCWNKGSAYFLWFAAETLKDKQLEAISVLNVLKETKKHFFGDWPSK
jgi:hypothetical protein